MIKSAENTIRAYGMLRPGDRVTVAVSGGADSIALLHYLWTNRERLSITVAAAHVDHGLRGSESRYDRFFVTGFCRARGIPLSLLEADVAAEAKASGEGIEECGRRVRYAFFETLGADKTATAHNADDNAETVLLNLARGTGLRGLCGIPPVRDNIIRPLIACTRDEILDYLRENRLDWREDASNESLLYRRNFVRHEILSRLRELSPEFSRQVADLSRRLSADADFLDAQAAKILEEARRDGGFAVSLLESAPPPLRSRALMRLCRERGVPCEARHVEMMRRTMGDGAPCTLPGGHVFSLRGELCGFFPAERISASEPADFCIPLSCGIWHLPAGTLEITRESGESAAESGASAIKSKKINNLLFKNSIDCGMIGFNPIIRPRKPGDRLRIPGRGLSKSLKKLFSEEKIPVPLRDKLPVIADDGGVLWAAGFGADQRALPTGGGAVFTITFTLNTV